MGVLNDKCNGCCRKLAASISNCGKSTTSRYYYCLLSPSSLWQLCAIISAIMFGSFFVFYLFKAIEFGQKVKKEWNNPGTSPSSTLSHITLNRLFASKHLLCVYVCMYVCMYV